MTRKLFVLYLASSCVLAASAVPVAAVEASSGAANKTPLPSLSQAPLTRPAVPLSPETLYSGWRATRIIGQHATSTAGGDIGTVQNILLDERGHIQALLVEGGGSAAGDEFIYRIPWEKIDRADFPNKVRAEVPHANDPSLDAFRGGSSGKGSVEFRVSEILGDYARLQPGLLYGYVSDVVFSPAGRMIAPLVVRTAPAGGGTYAFGFPGDIGAWNPRAGYYGLPYETSELATAAALRVDKRRFRDPDAS